MPIVDEHLAFERALQYDCRLDKVFVCREMESFFTKHGRKKGVQPLMYLPGFLISTSNVMGLSKVCFLGRYFKECFLSLVDC